jgi:hypothetical protein
LDNSFLCSLRSLRAIFSHRKSIDPSGASDYFVVLHIIKKRIGFVFWQSLIYDSYLISAVEDADKIETLDHQPRPRLSRSGPENNVVIVNFQIIINGMDVANEALRTYSEFLENVTKFNLNIMKTVWNPFLPYPFYPRLEDKK